MRAVSSALTSHTEQFNSANIYDFITIDIANLADLQHFILNADTYNLALRGTIVTDNYNTENNISDIRDIIMLACEQNCAFNNIDIQLYSSTGMNILILIEYRDSINSLPLYDSYDSLITLSKVISKVWGVWQAQVTTVRKITVQKARLKVVAKKRITHRI